jgi:hypothetical protein
MPDTRTARVGVHARNDFDFAEGDYQLIREARIETLKTLSFTKTEVFDRLRRENPLLEFIVRLHDIRIGPSHPSAEAFAATTIPRLNELRPFAVKFEIHNEPNHDQRFEGWGSTDDDARSFAAWYLEVLRRLKAACPWAQFGFPGLAPNWPHRDLEWLDLCREAVAASDWLGCHCYWQGDNMLNQDWGLRFRAYHEKFPNKVIEITEYGNATRNLSSDELAAQYVAYYGELFKYAYVGSASSFIASSSDPQWAPYVWRKENGELLPVVRQVGGMQRPALVLPQPSEQTPPYRVQWLDFRRPAALQAGQRASVSIKLMNAGTKTWLAGSVRLGYHWFTLKRQAVLGVEDLRTSLPANITPGMIVTLSQAQLAAPAAAGDYFMSWDLVEGDAGWFSAKGVPAYDFRISVSPSTVGDELYFAQTEASIKEPFLSFYRKYGQEFFGLPITNAFSDNGILSQYFERAALEQSAPDEVRLKAVGSEAWTDRARIVELDSQVRVLTEEVALLRAALSRVVPGGMAPRPEMQDLVQTLVHDDTKSYATRAMSDIKNLIVHHTAAPASVGPEAIARYQVKEHGWPGIGYHFMIMADGTIDQTNGLATISYHAQKANASSVGIAFAGNFMGIGPTEAQLKAGGRLLTHLVQLLGVPKENIKGHKDFVATQCPGDQWDTGLAWRDQLLAQVLA